MDLSLRVLGLGFASAQACCRRQLRCSHCDVPAACQHSVLAVQVFAPEPSAATNGKGRARAADGHAERLFQVCMVMVLISLCTYFLARLQCGCAFALPLACVLCSVMLYLQIMW